MSSKVQERQDPRKTIVLSPTEPHKKCPQIPCGPYFARVRALHDEDELKRRALAAFALAGTVARTELLHFAVVLPPASDPLRSVLYRSLARLDHNLRPEELLEDLMQHDLVRPMSGGERKVVTYSRFADLIKAGFLHDFDTARRLELTARSLKDLQRRLEVLPISGNVTVLDCAFADLKDGRSSVEYVHLKLDARPTIGHSSKLFHGVRKLTHSPVELEAVWEKRIFHIRSSVSISDLYSGYVHDGQPSGSSGMGSYRGVDDKVFPESRSPNTSTEDLPPPYESLDPNPAPMGGVQVGCGELDIPSVFGSGPNSNEANPPFSYTLSDSGAWASPEGSPRRQYSGI